jgi:hypothetical protein
MTSVIQRARRWAALGACGASVLAGLALVWCTLPADVLATTSTSELMLPVALLVLPGPALGALRLDRTARRRAVPEAPDRPTGGSPASPRR